MYNDIVKSNNSNQSVTPTDNHIQTVSYEPASPSPESIPSSNKKMNPIIIGLICGIMGIIIGGLCIFGLQQLIDKKPSNTEPTPCNCPACEQQTGSTDLTTAFLALEPQNQNMLYSPLSIRYGLSLLNAGAAGNTKTQIENVLDDETIPTYENIPDTLSLANAVFVRDDFKDFVLPSYLESVQEKYNSEIIYDSFASSNNMDNWVSQKTFNLINKIGFDPTPDTQMVLANALAIQMDWEHPFYVDDTGGKPFYKQNSEEIKATTMNQLTYSEDIKYHIDDNITMLSMPLQETNTGVNLDFVAIMPENNLEEYVNNIDSETINSVIANSISASTAQDGVKISIPKFKFKYELDFRSDLQNLGITDAFIKGVANFSAMANEKLWVSNAIHKANIDFSEYGIKAAAITVFAMAEDTAIADEPEPITINIDHPFLFLIRDRDNGAIWFIGTVYEPNLWSNDASSYAPIN